MFERFAVQYLQGDHRVEIGPDDLPSTYQRLSGSVAEWATVDLATEIQPDGRRIWAQGSPEQLTALMPGEYDIPHPDASFDVVLSGQVIEHVRQPWSWMTELRRVCRPGGLVITINPVSWPYHEAPVDCWRIYPEGMRALSDAAGLTVELCISDSLEPRPRRWFPGMSHNYDRAPWARRMNRVKSAMGWPLSVAFDTITIARRPAR